MKKWVKIVLGIIGVVILFLAVDLICIFTINRPLFAIEKESGTAYKGLLYDTYNCQEYSTPQIKAKGTKFTCATGKKDLGKVIELVDKTQERDGFACAEALESFYEDDNYTYYWNCIKNKYMVVKYESGFEEPISEALKNKTITISDLDRYNISYYREEK